jgi:hypothetical protein
MNKMIVSSSILKSAVEKYQRTRRSKERYSNIQAVAAGANYAFTTFVLIIAVLFFVLELIVLFYALGMAINCSSAGPERIVNIVLAITFTLPYVMLNILFNKCAKSTLQQKNLFLPMGTPSS